MAKDTEKLIRQLSLISYLMAERRPVTATEIRRDVEGYSRHERGRLRAPLLRRPRGARVARHRTHGRQPADGVAEQENYSLRREAFHLPAIAFTDSELAVAADRAVAARRRVRLRRAAAPGAAADHVGAPDPARPARDQRRSALGVTASAGGHELSQRPREDRHGDLPPQDHHVRLLLDAARRGTGHPQVDPYHLLYRDGQFYLLGRSHERDALRVFRLSRIRGKVAYATKAEHDFKRPADFDPRPYAHRAAWQMGDAQATAEVWISSASPGRSSATSAATAASSPSRRARSSSTPTTPSPGSSPPGS